MIQTRKLKYLVILLIVVALIAMSVGGALTQSAPTLGVASSFAVLGATTVTNTGSTIVNGNLGVSPGLAVTGFPPGIVVPPGTIHAGDAMALQAQNDVTTAYNALARQACTVNLTGLDLGGLILAQGVYCFDTSAHLTGQLTLDVQGNPDAVFIFKMGSTLITAPDSSVIFVNGTPSCNVFWQVGSSATLDTSTDFAGNILALTSITLNTDASVIGKVLARNGAVTMDNNNLAQCIPSAVQTDTPQPPTQTVIAATQTVIAPTLTVIAPTLTAIAQMPTSTRPPATLTAVAATQTAIAPTLTAVAPTLTAIAMTPPPTNLETIDQPRMPTKLYLQWLGH